MVRPKKLINRIPVITNVSMVYKLHLDEVAKKISEESGKVITVSELIRVALERCYPLVNYEYVYPDAEPLETPKKGEKKCPSKTVSQ